MSLKPKLTYVVTDLLTGSILDEIEVQSMHWSDIANRPGAGNATARIDDRTATRYNLASWQRGLWVLQGDQIVWGGYIGSVQPIATTRALTIPVFGFMEYLRHRFIRGIQGMSTHATLIGNSVTWTNTDKFYVAKDLIDHVQSFPNGNMHINVIWDGLSGEAITQTYKTYEWKYAGHAFEELSDNTSGWDWTYVYDFNGLYPRCNVKLSPTGTGYKRTPYRLEYDHRPGNKNIQAIDQNADTMPVNGIAGLGAGDGEAMVNVYVSDPNAGYPLFEDTIALKDISSASILATHVNKALQRQRTPINQITVTLDPELEPNYSDFVCQDEMLTMVDDGWMQYSAYFRVFQKDITIDEEGNVQAKISLELVGGTEIVGTNQPGVNAPDPAATDYIDLVNFGSAVGGIYTV